MKLTVWQVIFKHAVLGQNSLLHLSFIVKWPDNRPNAKMTAFVLFFCLYLKYLTNLVSETKIVKNLLSRTRLVRLF